MKRMRHILCATTVAILASPASAGDAPVVVYDNGAGGAAGVDSSILCDEDASFIVAADVAIPNDAAITAIEWTGIYFAFGATATDDFTISIFADDAANGVPSGAAMHEFPVGDAVNRVLSDDAFIYEYVAAVEFDLPADTTVWVSIVNNTAGESSNYYWGKLNSTDPIAASNDSAASWFIKNSSTLDFRLLGALADDCPADIAEDDGIVDTFDLLALLSAWGTNDVGADIAPPDNIIDTFDLLELLANWGPCDPAAASATAELVADAAPSTERRLPLRARMGIAPDGTINQTSHRTSHGSMGGSANGTPSQSLNGMWGARLGPGGGLCGPFCIEHGEGMFR